MTGKAVPYFISILFLMFLCSPSYSSDKMQTNNAVNLCMGTDLKALSSVRVSEKLYGLEGLGNVGRISPCVYRGKQPEQKGYQTLRSMGVRTIINLRSNHGERKEAEDAGMRYLEFPLSMTDGIKKEKLREIVTAMSDPSNQPLYVHCALGQDRTGVVVAAYRMTADSWSYEDALKEMQSFGFNDTWIHLKKSLKRYAEHIGKVPIR